MLLPALAGVKLAAQQPSTYLQKTLEFHGDHFSLYQSTQTAPHGSSSHNHHIYNYRHIPLAWVVWSVLTQSRNGLLFCCPLLTAVHQQVEGGPIFRLHLALRHHQQHTNGLSNSNLISKPKDN